MGAGGVPTYLPMPFGALVEPSDGCEIETDGCDEPPEEPPVDEGALGAGLEAAGVHTGAAFDAGVEGAAEDVRAAAGAALTAGAARWVGGFFTAA